MFRFAVCTALVLTTGCAATKAETKKEEPVATTAAAAPAQDNRPLYDRIGGMAGVEFVVDGFMSRALKDETMSYMWAGTDLPRVRQRIIDFICVGTGGPCKYTGRDMGAAHKHLHITGAQFDTLVGHLIEAMNQGKVPEREKGEILAILGPMKGAIAPEKP